MAYEFILAETRGKVGVITLNRPKQMNALNPRLMQELAEAMYGFDADDSVGAIVITGNEKAFAAGADIVAMKDWDFIEVYRSDYITRDWEHIRKIRKPVIAAVAGYALGGGNELAMACDLRYASEKARFGQPEINLGIIPGDGGTQRLARLLGEGKAMEWILTGDIYNAQTALELGLVNAIFPPEELETKTMEIARKVAEKSPIALRYAKEAIKIAAKSNLDEGLRREVDLFAICFSSRDKEEGINAFLEKRKAAFTGE